MKINKIPGYIILFICLVFLSIDVKSVDQNLTSLLPGIDDIESWSPVDSAKRYAGDDLFDYINGGADIYLEYGFVEVIAMEYANINNKFVQIEIYQMASNESAYGIYSLNKSPNGEIMEIGNEAVLSDYYMILWKDDYIVNLIGYSSDDETIEGIISLAEIIDIKIENKGTKPGLMGILPEEGLIKNENTFIRGNIGLINNYFFAAENIFGIKEGAIGNYETFRVFIFKYKSEEESRKWFVNAAEAINTLSKYSNYVGDEESFAAVDRRQNSIYCSFFKNYIYVLVGENLSDKDRMIFYIKKNM